MFLELLEEHKSHCVTNFCSLKLHELEVQNKAQVDSNLKKGHQKSTKINITCHI